MAGKPTKPVVIRPDNLTLSGLRAAYAGPATVELSAADQARIKASQKTVEKVLSEGRTVYGINTGFGILAHTKIAPGQLKQLQKNLVLSHMA